jgi:hypothetical protein
MEEKYDWDVTKEKRKMRDENMSEQIGKVIIKFQKPIIMNSEDVLNLIIKINIRGKEINHENPSRRDN